MTSATPRVKPGQLWRQITWADPREAQVTAVRRGVVYYQQGIRWRATVERFLAQYELVGEPTKK